MKKLIIFIFIIIVITVCTYNTVNTAGIFALSNNGRVSFYINDDIANATKNTCFFDEYSIIKNGIGYILETDIKYAEKEYANLKNCVGFSVKYDTNLSQVNQYIEQINIVKRENVSDIEILYGYIPSLYDSIFIDNKKVNIQVAKCVDGVILGCPIILGSY